MDKKYRFDLALISRHRAFLYGFAVMWVVLVHISTSDLPGKLGFVLSWLKENGRCGVDIFVLLSGMGLYRSLTRDPRVGSFYARRLSRVLPAAFISTAIGTGFLNSTLAEYFGAITFFLYWFGMGTHWFIPFILTMYLFYPAIHAIQKRCAWSLWILLILFEMFNAYVCTHYDTAFFDYRSSARIPIFLLGCILAPQLNKASRSIPVWLAPLFLLGYLATTQLPDSLGMLPRYIGYHFLAPFMIMMMSLIAQWLTRSNLRMVFYRCLALCGGISLELYILHFEVVQLLGEHPVYSVHHNSTIKRDFVAFLIAFILALLLKRFCAYLASEFKRAAQADGAC